MKFLAGYVMRGPTQAVLVTSVLAVLSLLLPPLSYLVGAAVALVTLRLGAGRGLVVSGGAALAVSLLLTVVIQNPVPGPAYLMAVWLPLWALAMHLRRTSSLDRTLLLAAAFGGAMVVAFHAGVDDTVGFWQKAFEGPLSEAVQQSPESAAAVHDAMRVMTGTIAAAVILSLLISLFIARWWQAVLYHAGGFQREFHGLRFRRGLALATVAIAIRAMLDSPKLAAFAGDLLMVVLVLHLLHGLAVAHGLIHRKGASIAWLVAVYALLVSPLVLGTALTLAAVGFADAWFDFRAFFGTKTKEG